MVPNTCGLDQSKQSASGRAKRKCMVSNDLPCCPVWGQWRSEIPHEQRNGCAEEAGNGSDGRIAQWIQDSGGRRMVSARTQNWSQDGMDQ